MRAVRLTEEDIVLADLPLPSSDGAQALGEVSAVGLCDSDQTLAPRAPERLPFTLGHEHTGRVALAERAHHAPRGAPPDRRPAHQPASGPTGRPRDLDRCRTAQDGGTECSPRRRRLDRGATRRSRPSAGRVRALWAERERLSRPVSKLIVRRELLLDPGPDRARALGLEVRGDLPAQATSIKQLVTADSAREVPDAWYLFTDCEGAFAALKELDAAGLTHVVLRAQWSGVGEEQVPRTQELFRDQGLPPFR